MAVTATNLLVGARDITIDGANIGALVGGVELLYASEKFLHKVDQKLGILAVDKIDEEIRVRFRMAEATLENLRIAMAQPSWALSSADPAGPTLNIGSQRAMPTAHAVVITGKAPGATDKTRTITIGKAVIEEGGTHAYTKDGRTEYEVTMICLVDTSKAEGFQVLSICDSDSAFSFA